MILSRLLACRRHLAPRARPESRTPSPKASPTRPSISNRQDNSQRSSRAPGGVVNPVDYAPPPSHSLHERRHDQRDRHRTEMHVLMMVAARRPATAPVPTCATRAIPFLDRPGSRDQHSHRARRRTAHRPIGGRSRHAHDRADDRADHRRHRARACSRTSVPRPRTRRTPAPRRSPPAHRRPIVHHEMSPAATRCSPPPPQWSATRPAASAA